MKRKVTTSSRLRSTRSRSGPCRASSAGVGRPRAHAHHRADGRSEGGAAPLAVAVVKVNRNAPRIAKEVGKSLVPKPVLIVLGLAAVGLVARLVLRG